MDNEKEETRNNRRHRIAKCGKHLKAWIKGKLQVVRNIGSGHNKKEKEKIRKRVHYKNKKTSRKWAL